MDSAEKDRIIAQIICREIPVTILTYNKTHLSLFLHPPTPKEHAKSVAVYSSEYQLAISEGLLNEQDTIENMIAIGKWSNQTDIEIDGLKKDIHKIRRGLLDFLFNKTKLEKVRKLLRSAESALLKRLARRHNLLQQSAEIHALTCQQRYLVRYVTKNEDGSLFWKTDKDFDDSNDMNTIIQLCELIFLRSHLSTEVIRELARSQQWKMFWEISKNTNDLFEGPVTSWSWNQIELAYWSTIYDSVNEAYERPSREVIDDDDLLDSWFIRQSEKNNAKANNTVSSQPNKSGRNEEFIMSDKEGAKQVYNMNDPMSRAKIKARQKILHQKGVIREQDMPDSQGEMRQQLANKQISRVKDITRR